MFLNDKKTKSHFKQTRVAQFHYKSRGEKAIVKPLHYDSHHKHITTTHNTHIFASPLPHSHLSTHISPTHTPLTYTHPYQVTPHITPSVPPTPLPHTHLHPTHTHSTHNLCIYSYICTSILYIVYRILYCIVRTIRFCSNFTSMWSKYLSNNVSISNGNIKYPSSQFLQQICC